MKNKSDQLNHLMYLEWFVVCELHRNIRRRKIKTLLFRLYSSQWYRVQELHKLCHSMHNVCDSAVWQKVMIHRLENMREKILLCIYWICIFFFAKFEEKVFRFHLWLSYRRELYLDEKTDELFYMNVYGAPTNKKWLKTTKNQSAYCFFFNFFCIEVKWKRQWTWKIVKINDFEETEKVRGKSETITNLDFKCDKQLKLCCWIAEGV